MPTAGRGRRCRPARTIRPVLRRLLFILAVLLLIEQLTLLAWAVGTYGIVQKDRSFHPEQIAIAAGDTLRFTNEDGFLHQIYVNSPKMTFESDEQPLAGPSTSAFRRQESLRFIVTFTPKCC
jgi:hypothetical protein